MGACIGNKLTLFLESLLQWSYGVTVWEIFSGGKVPYPGVDPLTLIQLLEAGHRMNKPTNAACTDEMSVEPYSHCIEVTIPITVVQVCNDDEVLGV